MIRQLIRYAVLVATFLLVSALGEITADAQSGGDVLREFLEDTRRPKGGKQSVLDRTRADVKVPPGAAVERPPAEDGTEKPVDEAVIANHYCKFGDDAAARQLLQQETKLSLLEIDFCQRARRYLPLYGYAIFGDGAAPYVLASGAVDNNYVLGVGDELILTFVGQITNTEALRVDHEGRIVEQRLGSLEAAGRTLGDFRNELQARVAAALTGTQVFITVGTLRLMPVIVAGEVERPGRYWLTSLSTVMDALGLAGGIKKSGSLRNIKLERGGKVNAVDLYDLLFGGDDHRQVVKDGDRIIVPVLGAAVAVSGKVRRPGLFELPPGAASVSTDRVVGYAGGTVRPRGNKFLDLTFDESGNQKVIEIGSEGGEVSDGDLLVVYSESNLHKGLVEVAGHVTNPGQRPLASSPTVGALVPGPGALVADPYLLFAALETTDPDTQARRLVPLDLQRVVNGEEDYPLREGDVFIVLGAQDIKYLGSAQVQNVLRGLPLETERGRGGIFLSAAQVRGVLDGGNATFSTKEDDPARASLGNALKRDPLKSSAREALGEAVAERVKMAEAREGHEFAPPFKSIDAAKDVCRGLVRLSAIVADGQNSRFVTAQRPYRKKEWVSLSNFIRCPPIYDRFPDLLPFVLEHAVALNGEIRNPGIYPVAETAPVKALAAAAGGTTRQVDLTRIEVARLDYDSVADEGAVDRDLVSLVIGENGGPAVKAGDVVRFNPVFTVQEAGPVELDGEVVRPGTYEIQRGERLSELLERAGGVTPQAYPYGTVFLRESVRRSQLMGFRRAARELNASLAVAAVQKGIDPQSLVALQRLTDELFTAETLGRVVVEADPAVLRVRPELDSVLEPGDRISVPRRPNFVLILGDVLNPGAIQFSSGRKVSQYIAQAGGFQVSADKGKVFIVYPNGIARPISTSVWKFSSEGVPPGSTVVVPKDPTPLNLLALSRDFATIFSQLALSAASIAVISNRR